MTKQAKKNENINRCERCSRQLKDQTARYGWRCAEILGIANQLNHSGDEAFNDFNRGVNDASGYLRKKRINVNTINLPKFYTSYAKRYLAEGMGNGSLWVKANNDIRAALNPTYDGRGRIILEPDEAPELDEVLDLRDNYDYQRGSYTTTAYLEKQLNPHVRIIQQNLNKLGLADKFSSPLKEDGILGPKTQWVMDSSSIFDGIGKAVFASSGSTMGKNQNSSQSNQPRDLPIAGFGGKEDRRGNNILDSSSRDRINYLPYISKLLNKDFQPANLPADAPSDDILAIINAGFYMGGDSPLSRRQKETYSKALTKTVSNYGKAERPGLVTSSMLKDFNWENTSQKEVDAINRALTEYGITSPESIAMFMATAAAESDYGRYVLEQGTDAYFEGKDYSKEERGVGYLQLTHRDAQLKFLERMEDDYKGANTAEHIAETYDPWIVSAYVWANQEFGEEVIMNDYVNAHGDSDNLVIFLITQYFINGYPDGIDSYLKKIRSGTPYTIDIEKNKLYVGGKEFNLPNGWKKRAEAYNNAVKAIK